MDISNPQFREEIIAFGGQIIRPFVATMANAAAVTPRESVLVWKDQSIDEYYMPRAIREVNGALLWTKIFNIGVWDMDADPTKYVDHNEDFTKIVWAGGYVWNDAESQWCPFATGATAAANILTLWVHIIDSTRVLLQRSDGSRFDGISFNDGVMNRGEIILTLRV